MELLGIEMATRLAVHVKEAISDVKTITLWSDSKTALQWMNMDTGELQILVHNYVEKSLKRLPLDRFRWVPGEINPADNPTRPKFPQEIALDRQWIEGPDFLHEPPDSWPVLSELTETDEVLKEVKKDYKYFTPLTFFFERKGDEKVDGCVPARTLEIHKQHRILPWRYSDYGKYKRTISYFLTFVRKARRRARLDPEGKQPLQLLSKSESKSAFLSAAHIAAEGDPEFPNRWELNWMT
jgi:hypothetical protein